MALSGLSFRRPVKVHSPCLRPSDTSPLPFASGCAGTPTRAHRRGASVDYQQSKEDLLDNIFSSYTGGWAGGWLAGWLAGAPVGGR